MLKQAIAFIFTIVTVFIVSFFSIPTMSFADESGNVFVNPPEFKYVFDSDQLRPAQKWMPYIKSSKTPIPWMSL